MKRRELIAGALALVAGAATSERYATRASEDPADLAAFAAELIKLSPQVIYANGDEASRVVAAASASIPIVAMTDDHIASRQACDMSEPDGVGGGGQARRSIGFWTVYDKLYHCTIP